MNKKVILPLILLVFSLLYLCSGAPVQFHTTKEIEFYRGVADTLHEGYNGLFAASGDCEACHGYDVNGIASNAGGELGDVNVVDDWKTTMMAMSAKDPFWRAKVSHEVLVNPEHQVEIEDKCTSCHGSLGHFAAFHEGAEHYSMEDLESDPWALDGVSCLSCHQQQNEEGLGSRHSGDIRFDTNKVAYGPYISPLTSPMVMATGYWPEYSEHISDAGICASCHTLITQTIDLDGNFVDNTFVEQATYHEWLNSTYDDQDISCQDCHMPNLGDTPIFLIAGKNTAPRTNFSIHEFAGANSFMLKLMKENKDVLDLVGSDEDFDQTINATLTALQSQSADVDMELLQRDSETASFNVTISNLAGHKFPSGYPSRRLFLQFVVEDEDGNTLFSSGETGENFILLDEVGEYEPHYEEINNEDQVQIYEMVMGDVNGDLTTVLDRAASQLKDNRLLPIGFSFTDEVIDTVQVYGTATLDNQYIGEGAALGTDEIIYNIPLEGYQGPLSVEVKAFYQSIPHKWLEEIFAVNTEEIDLFRDMYEGADKTPVLVDSDQIELDEYVGIEELNTRNILELTYDASGTPFINSVVNSQLDIYSMSGALVHSGYLRAGWNQFPIAAKGVYLAHTGSNNGILKVVVN